jgi:hypothetical protein
MQSVLSSDLWKVIRAKARTAKRRKAAIAYVTQELVRFRKGDVLVVDASKRAIACGETDAALLRMLQKREVRLYHCADLHAKVLLLDDVAVISSGNMSKSSADGLVEAGLVTDHGTTVSAVASFIEQVIRQSNELLAKDIATLCKIKVVRRDGRETGGRKKFRTKVGTLGNRTWLVGVRELVRAPKPDDQGLIDRAIKSLRKRLGNPDEEPSWIRWGLRGRFAGECQKGDTLIQILRSRRAKLPSTVLRATPVLLKQPAKQWTRFYLGEATGPHTEVSWYKFKRLLNQLGYPRRVSAGMVHLLDPDMADAIARKWNSTAKL